jgi:hypothetical protein
MGNTATQNAEIQKILAAGVPQSYIDAHPELRKGDWIDPQDTQRFIDSWNASPEKTQAEEAQKTSALQTRIDALPDSLKNDPSFQALPADMKEIAIYNYEIQKANDQDKANKLAIALETATEQADPYWKNIIRIAQDEVLRGVESANGDYTSAMERQQRRILELNQDLERNKDYLSLDQQAELGKLSADLQDKQETYQRNVEYLGAEKAAQLQGAELDYQKSIDDINRNMDFSTEEKNAALKKLDQQFKIQKDNITQGAAEAGLTFSTKRKIAENRLKESNEGLVESTNRMYNKTMADLQSNLEYTGSQYGQQTGNIERQFGLKLAEEGAYMDTATRQMQEARDKLQRDYAKQIADLEIEAGRGNTEAQAQMADLQRKLNESVTATGRAGEAYLGTENMPQLEGYAPLGGVTGQVYEDQVKDIEARKQAIYGELNQSSLNI